MAIKFKRGKVEKAKKDCLNVRSNGMKVRLGTYVGGEVVQVKRESEVIRMVFRWDKVGD